MTKSWRFYLQVMATLRSYQNCEIDLSEAAHQVEESYLWVYGQSKKVKELVGHFEQKKLKIFFWLAAKNS